MADQSIFSLVIILLTLHNHFSWQHMDIVRRKLMLVTIGTQRVKSTCLIQTPVDVDNGHLFLAQSIAFN